MYGYWNRILRCDLDSESIEVTELAKHEWQRDIGGSALGTKMLYEDDNATGDPLAPSAPLIFATGPYQGSGLPGSAKFAIVGRSPMSGTFAVTTAGAGWGIRCKRAGYDAIVITGRAQEPMYLLITDNEVELCSANELWGCDALDTCNRLAGDSKTSVAAIGVAGENQVAAACIVVDSHSFAGRCGLGAVMGSKNLKAVVVSGSKSIPLHSPERVDEIKKREFSRLRDANKDTFARHGTAGTLADCEAIGDLPIANWSGDVWPQGAQRISAPNYTEVLQAKPWPCMSCPIGCHRKISGEVNGPGPEYESLAMLGANTLIDDVVLLAKANDMCNRMGLDTISVGSWAGLLMECVATGRVGANEFSQERADWGNGQFLLEFIDQVANQKGAGQLFSEGIRKGAYQLGASELAVEVKGVDFPAHDPRTYFSLAVNYATSTRGACHLRGFPHCGEAGMLIPELSYDRVSKRFTMQGKAEITKLFQDYSTVIDSLVCCCFMQITGMSLTSTVQGLTAITGWDMEPSDLITAGERAFVRQRLINVRDGFSHVDDRLPQRMYEPANRGPRKGKTPDLKQALPEYYRLRGWDERGVPTDKCLQRLGI